MNETDLDLAIIGAGPAGFTAGIYAGRAGLRTVILEKQMAGGQVMVSPAIENWPGDKEISGPDLVQKMREHAETYARIMEFSEVTSAQKDGPFVLETPEGTFKARAVIIATGAHHKKLSIEGEDELAGRGVSYCATCDGFFFKGKEVAVIGGGNTALLYALYLNNIGCMVTLVHRRDKFRAEQALQDKVRKLPIKLVLETVVEKFIGNEELSTLKIRNVRTGHEGDLHVSGAFVAVGEEPQNGTAKMLGVAMDKEGYIIVDRGMRTSVPGVFAAGDITGGLKQIIVAAGEGAVAATSAFEALMEPYWIK